MTDVEVIEFFVPHTSTSNLYIPEIKLAEEEGGEARDSSALKQAGVLDRDVHLVITL